MRYKPQSSIFTGMPQAQLQAALAAAQQAYLDLSTGGKPVTVKARGLELPKWMMGDDGADASNPAPRRSRFEAIRSIQCEPFEELLKNCLALGSKTSANASRGSP